jgi:ATP-binding cassette subfamily B protein
MSLPKNIASFIWHFIKKQPLGFFIVVLTGVIWSINEMFFPYFIKWIINTIANYHGIPKLIYHVLWPPLLLFGALWVMMELAMRTQGITLIYLFPKFRTNIRETVFDYIKHHSHQYFSDNFAGSIAKKLSELPNSCQTLSEIMFFNFVPILLAFIIAFALMANTKPLFAVLLLVWFIFHMGFTLIFMGSNNKKWGSHSDAVTTLSGKIVDILTNMLTVRLFARSKYESSYINQFQQDEMTKAHKAMWSVELMRFFQGISAIVFMIATIGTLIHGWINGWVTIGDFSLIGMLAFWILRMIWYMSYQLMIFMRETATVREALNLVSVGHDILDATNATPLQVQTGEIQFSNVSFSYHKGRPVFSQFNLIIKAGQKVGLVGFSGSGKSTFVNLLLRFYDLQEGQILIDNQDISQVLQESLREQIAMIPQDPTLFHRSLGENIGYGNLEATEEEIIMASKLAHCHEFIKELPEGYETLVGERGVKLSGGQRQRIAIARAIVKNAPILILDEATSSLDSITEKFIQQSLHNLMQGRTTIVVAHRLSTLSDMDRIIVFDQGRVVEDGTIAELIAQQGHFAKLWQMQKDGFLPEE